MRIFRPYRLLALAPLILSAAVIDRIAVVVGSSVITQTELQREVRLTEFLNHQPLDVGPAARRAAADRMVDRDLLAGEMKLSDFAMPATAEADPLFAQVERGFPSPAQFRAALQQYGLTEAEVRRYLLWQVAMLRFTDVRFPPPLPTSPEPSADRAQEGAAPTANPTTDTQLDDWLKQARANTHIEFKPEAFE